MANYYIKDKNITGTVSSPQTIRYSDLVDVDGNSLPSTFSITPFIMIASKYNDRDVHIVNGSKTTSLFQVAMSNLSGDLSISNVLVDMIIIGS